MSDPQGANRIILVHLDHRGDFLMASEAFKIFRDAFKDAEITLVLGSRNVGEAQQTAVRQSHAVRFPPGGRFRGPTMPTREVLLKTFVEQAAHEIYDLAVGLRLSEDTREVLGQSGRATVQGLIAKTAPLAVDRDEHRGRPRPTTIGRRAA